MFDVVRRNKKNISVIYLACLQYCLTPDIFLVTPDKRRTTPDMGGDVRREKFKFNLKLRQTLPDCPA